MLAQSWKSDNHLEIIKDSNIGKTDQFDSATKIILYFVCSNIIFADCTFENCVLFHFETTKIICYYIDKALQIIIRDNSRRNLKIEQHLAR